MMAKKIYRDGDADTWAEAMQMAWDEI